MADIFGDIDHVPCLGTAGCFFPMVVDFKRLPVPNGGLLNVFNLGGLLLI